MKRSKFSLSNYKLLTMSMGELVPIGLTEALPGDSIQQSTSALIRSTPLLAPVMHPVHVRIHHWFVPFRLLWEDWENFITGGPDGMDASAFPVINSDPGTRAEGDLLDYLGIPPTADGDVSALPVRAYQMIFNEFYRDQDLVTEATIDLSGGADTTTSTTLKNCAWEKDYFTTARPWAQKGPDITIPTGGIADVISNSQVPTFSGTGAGITNQQLYHVTGASADLGLGSGSGPATQTLIFGNESGLGADLGSVTSVPGSEIPNINELRLAFALQRYEEARARYGSRYTEYLRYLGVRSSDARLQRPEYLGGGKQTIQFSEVLQTGVTTDGDDSEGVGNLKGHGISALRSNRYRRFIEEHGYIVTMMSVRPKTMYTQGIPRHWSKRTKEEFYQKELQAIGQQSIRLSELYGVGVLANTDFGFQNRYDEYRRTESSIAGSFRSTLNYWHLSREFASPPTLNGDFVTCNPSHRINAVTTGDNLLVMANHSIQARRIVAADGGQSYVY